MFIGQVLLSYDFARWRRLLIRDNQLSIGIVVNVIFLGLALCNHSETKKKGETKCKIQSRTWPPNSDSTGLWPSPMGGDYVDSRWDVLLWCTFFEGSAKIHMLARRVQWLLNTRES
jgi:hypothetical protein